MNYLKKIKRGKIQIMDISHGLAHIWGFYLIIVGSAYITRKINVHTLAEELASKKAITYITAILTLMIGLITITLHNVWQLDWRLIVTLLGFISTIKGIFLLYYPEMFPKFAKFIQKSGHGRLIGAIAVIFGLFLVFCSYFL